MSKNTNYVEMLRNYRKANEPLLIFGGPGIGKSEICKQAADGDEVKDVRLSMMEPIDMRGMPVIGKVESKPSRKSGEDGVKVVDLTSTPTVEWARPDFLPTSGSGIILFDELNTADPSVQNAALQFILDRRCGPHKLGDGWWIVACGNKNTHKAHVNPLSAPLRNRFTIIEMEADFNQWRNWAMTIGNVHADVLGFMSATSGEHLYQPPVDEYGNFPTPRAWARVSRLITAGIEDREAIEGTVGKAAAGWFLEYRRETKNMPDIDALLEGKATYEDGPSKLSLTYAVVSNLLHRTIKKLDLLDKAAGVFQATNIRPEIASLFFAGIMAQKDNNVVTMLIKSKNFKAWNTKHSALLEAYKV